MGLRQATQRCVSAGKGSGPPPGPKRKTFCPRMYMYINNTVKRETSKSKNLLSLHAKRLDVENLIIYDVCDGHSPGAFKGIQGHRNSFPQRIRGIQGASRGIEACETQGILGIEPGEVYAFKILKGNRMGRSGALCVHF